METVLDVLKAMGKTTYRDVAARLDIEPVVALNMLREQKEQGLCDYADGGWFLGTAAKQKPKRIRPKQESDLVGRILAAMQGQGAISAEKIAKLLGKTPRGPILLTCHSPRWHHRHLHDTLVETFGLDGCESGRLVCDDASGRPLALGDYTRSAHP